MRTVNERLSFIERQLERLRSGPTAGAGGGGGDPSYVPVTRNITAGAGLTGGGTLDNDLVLNVGGGTLISIGANSVNLANGTAQYQVPMTGSSPFTPSWVNIATLAGNGLVFTGGDFDVGQGNGITVLGNEVELTIPGTVGVSSINTSVGSHTHQIDHANDVGNTPAAKILSSTSQGYLTAARLIATDRLRAPLLDTAAGHLTIKPAADLLLEPGTSLAKLQSGVALQSYNYASQLTGLRLTQVGEIDCRYLFTDQLHAKAFIADLEQALAGGQIISKSVAEIAVTFTAPAAGAQATLIVRDLPSAPDMQVFQSGDIVRLRKFTRTTTSLSITDCWGTVGNPVDGTDLNGIGEGRQQWTFTRSTSPNAGAMATGTQIKPDSLVLDYGVSGNGYYEVNAIDGLNGANSPYLQFVRWTGHPATGQSIRLRAGQLRGIFNQDEFGFFAGTGTGNADRWLRLSDYALGTGINNLPFRMYDNNTEVIHFGNWNDIWWGRDSANRRLEFDGTTLVVRGQIAIQSGSSGYTNFSDKPTSLSGINSTEGSKLSGIEPGATLGATWNVNMTPPLRFRDAPAASGLYLTATNMGFWNSSANAWKTWMDSSGNFYFGGSTGASLRWNGSVLGGWDASNNVQWYARSADGKLYFGGAGNSTPSNAGGLLDEDGMALKATSGLFDVPSSSIMWYVTPTTRTTEIARITAGSFDLTGTNAGVAVSLATPTHELYVRKSGVYNAVWHEGNLTPASYALKSGETFTGAVNAPTFAATGQVSSNTGSFRSGTTQISLTDLAGGYIQANTGPLNLAAITSTGWAGRATTGTTGSGFGYYEYYYGASRMGYLDWRTNYFGLRADGRWAVITGTRVGINTTSPGFDIDMVGEGRISGALRTGVAFSLQTQASVPAVSSVYGVLYVNSGGQLYYIRPNGSQPGSYVAG